MEEHVYFNHKTRQMD